MFNFKDQDHTSNVIHDVVVSWPVSKKLQAAKRGNFLSLFAKLTAPVTVVYETMESDDRVVAPKTGQCKWD